MLCISYNLQRKLRQQILDDVVASVKKKELDELVKREGIHKQNDAAMKKLMKDQPEEATLDNLPIQSFAIPQKKELSGFLHVRFFTTSAVEKNPNNPPFPTKKGKLTDPEGANNLICAAHAARNRAIILPRPDTDDNGDVAMGDDDVGVGVGRIGDEDEEVPPRLIVDSSSSSTAAVVTPPRSILTIQPPSFYLSNTTFQEIAIKCIRGALRMEANELEEEIVEHADKIGRMLRKRLGKHIRTKIADSTKHNHPALLFVQANLNRFAALLCFFKQNRRCNRVLNSKSCLLEHPSRGGFLPATDVTLEGSYLHYSNEELQWIRSGKAVGSDSSSPINGLVYRNEQGHMKKAMVSTLLDGECFYTLYPSRLNTSQLPNKIGHFEDLTQYCGFSFRRENDLEGLTSTDEGKCMFDWSVYINHLDRSKLGGLKTLREKQLTVIGYFFELCYDICLSPSQNVSNNPGFESIIGVFNNASA